MKNCLMKMIFGMEPLLPIVLLAVSMNSCVERIPMDEAENPQVVVECVLKMDTVQTMNLYWTRTISEDVNQPVEDAKVSLVHKVDSKDVCDTVARFHRVEGKRWQASFKPKYGLEYELVVKVPGREKITATTRFPYDFRLVAYMTIIRDGGRHFKDTTDHGEIISRFNYNNHNVNDTVEFFARTYEVSMASYTWFDEKSYGPATDRACKMWILPHVDTTQVRPARHEYTYGTRDKGDTLLYRGSRQPLCNYAVTDHPGVDNFNVVSGTVSDLKWCRQPITCVWTMNGNYGVWADSNYSQWCTFMCPDLPLHGKFLRIDHPADFTNGLSEEDLKSSYQWSANSFFICGDYNERYPRSYRSQQYSIRYQSYINEVHFVSDEYDSYLRALYVKYFERDDFILSAYDYENVYTNINGGLGVFGADLVSWDETSYDPRRKKTRFVRL